MRGAERAETVPRGQGGTVSAAEPTVSAAEPTVSAVEPTVSAAELAGAGGWWRRKSSPAKVETYTRWSFHFFGLAEFAAVGVPFGSGVWRGPVLWLPLIMAVHCTLSVVTASRALDWTRGRRPRPVRLLVAFALVTAVVATVALWSAEHGPGGEEVDTAAGGIFGVALVFAAGVTTLGVRGWRQSLAVVTGYAAASGALALLLGAPGPAVSASVAAVLIGGGFMATTSLFSVWLLDTVYRLDGARETRARLAVAEERLRFGRDLHDVMGRNLAVIALKSELAVQLARRGRPEAVEQMIEVQRIARESQREVRDVVRGYRDADLGVELLGAKGVLTAAGIECEVRGEAGGLPAEVQSALGWVVRETTTNVLRHGNAGRCAVQVRRTGGKVVLTVENDGAHGDGADGEGAGVGVGSAGVGGDGVGSAGVGSVGVGSVGVGSAGVGSAGVGSAGVGSAGVGSAGVGSAGVGGDGVGSAGVGSAGVGSAGGGSGLAGLAERLRKVGGTLEAGIAGAGVFLVVAEVPLVAEDAVVTEVLS